MAENLTLLGTVSEFVGQLRARELAEFKLALAIALHLGCVCVCVCICIYMYIYIYIYIYIGTTSLQPRRMRTWGVRVTCRYELARKKPFSCSPTPSRCNAECGATITFQRPCSTKIFQRRRLPLQDSSCPGYHSIEAKETYYRGKRDLL